MNIISPLILVVASVWLFIGYINPTYTGKTGSVEPSGKSIVELQVDEQNYTNALTKTKEIERFRTGLAAKFDALNPSDVEEVEKLLPDHIDTVRLILDINNIAEIIFHQIGYYNALFARKKLFAVFFNILSVDYC